MRTITDSKELHKLVAYLTMGDGGVYKSRTAKNAYFVMTQREDHRDFCEYAASILENVTSVRVKQIDRSKDGDGYNRMNQLRVETPTHPLFTQMRERIYTDTYKGVDPHYLKQLDWETAAILFMCDGSAAVYQRSEIGMVRPSVTVTLNLKRLSYGDQVLLKRALEEKEMGTWRISRQNQYYFLRLSVKHASLFLNGIAPYVVPSYRYKLEWLTPARAG